MEYRYNAPKSFDPSRMIKFLIGFSIAFVAVLIIALSVQRLDFGDDIFPTNYPVELALGSKYVPMKLVGIDPAGMTLATDCYKLLIPITSDQLFSISNGITQDFSRPLTHDIFKTALDHYGVRPIHFSIDKWENELWYATLRLQKGFDVLDMDVRPSDGVAMSVRYNLTMYIDEQALQKKATYVC